MHMHRATFSPVWVVLAPGWHGALACAFLIRSFLPEPSDLLCSLQAAVTRAVLTSGGLPMLVGCAQLMDCPEASIISGRCLQLMVEQQPELRNQVVDIAEQQGDTSLKTLFPGNLLPVQAAFLTNRRLLRGVLGAAAMCRAKLRWKALFPGGL